MNLTASVTELDQRPVDGVVVGSLVIHRELDHVASLVKVNVKIPVGINGERLGKKATGQQYE
jgi:hypothetical protein